MFSYIIALLCIITKGFVLYPLDAYTANNYNNASAGVAEQADAADLKSAGAILVGSSPTPGTS